MVGTNNKRREKWQHKRKERIANEPKKRNTGLGKVGIKRRKKLKQKGEHKN
jgi:hypothetical protein